MEEDYSSKSSDDDTKKPLFRQVTVLPALNNVFEKILPSQLTSYFQKIFCDFLSAYRRHHSCQTILFIVEEGKKKRDKGELVAIVTMDLSKAFDFRFSNAHTLIYFPAGLYMTTRLRSFR